MEKPNIMEKPKTKVAIVKTNSKSFKDETDSLDVNKLMAVGYEYGVKGYRKTYMRDHVCIMSRNKLADEEANAIYELLDSKYPGILNDEYSHIEIELP